MIQRPHLVSRRLSTFALALSAIVLLLGAGVLTGCSFMLWGRDYRFAAKPEEPVLAIVKPPPAPKPLGWCYDLMKPGYATLPICGYPWQNTRGNGINITADWDGSCFGEHGPQCLPNPSAKNCAPIGPGWAAHLGATCGFARRQLAGETAYAQGFWFVTDDGVALHLNGPYSKNQCMKLAPAPKPRRSYCLGIGKIGNTEGSTGGP